jgi:hypothetical protein
MRKSGPRDVVKEKNTKIKKSKADPVRNRFTHVCFSLKECPKDIF